MSPSLGATEAYFSSLFCWYRACALARVFPGAEPEQAASDGGEDPRGPHAGSGGAAVPFQRGTPERPHLHRGKTEDEYQVLGPGVLRIFAVCGLIGARSTSSSCERTDEKLVHIIFHVTDVIWGVSAQP